jgi:hypothetical protein
LVFIKFDALNIFPKIILSLISGNLNCKGSLPLAIIYIFIKSKLEWKWIYGSKWSKTQNTLAFNVVQISINSEKICETTKKKFKNTETDLP